MAQDEPRPIIVKRVKKMIGGHHGGAWKVAYADFTTAMMAFFMLLWLLNVTTKVQREGLANYFAPTAASNSQSGAGGVLGGNSLSSDGSENSGAAVVISPAQTPPPQSSSSSSQSQSRESAQQIEDNAWKRQAAKREEAMFQATEAELRQSIQEMADLHDMAGNLVIDVTKDGMRIQLIDNDRRSMFKSGTAQLYGYAKKMLIQIAQSINKLPNRIAITGHTDGIPFVGKDGYNNWDLSTDRANAARRVLIAAHVSPDRIFEVSGKGASDPLLPEAPDRPENRRISILLIREAPVLPPGGGQ